MKPKFILSVLYFITSFLFIVFTIAIASFLLKSIINMHAKSISGFESQSMDINCYISIYDKGITNVDFSYTADSTIRYKPVINEYTVQVKSNTPLAYYYVLIKLIYLCLGITVSWFFLKILKDLKLDNPFKFRFIKYLKIIALLFISSDILKFINNLIFNQYIHQSVLHPRFHLPSVTIGISNGILLGLVIWIIAIIFQRGVELQKENDLTV